MRDEMLKRFDELMAGLLQSRTVLGWAGAPETYIPETERRAWAVLRAELVAERCENCTYAEATYAAEEHGFLRCTGLNLSDAGGATLCCVPDGVWEVSPDFCCAHFTAKKR